MAIQFQLRRGTTVQNNAFVGAEGEITVDTEKHAMRIHDGVTPGGYTQDFVTEAWISEDGLSWYRKYSSGWVEQGGFYNRTTTGTMYMTLPVEMADTNYTAICSCSVKDRTSDFTSNWTFAPYTTSTVQIYTSSTVYGNYSWQVSGLGAQ